MNIFIQRISKISIQNKYLKWYINIINTSLLRQQPREYTEKHHILPKCFKMGGIIDINNLVVLTAKEHLICHRLLVKFTNDKILKSKVAYAAWQMGTFNSQKRFIKINSRTYASLKKKTLSLSMKGIPKTEQHKQNMRKPKSTTKNMGAPKGTFPWITGKHHSKETKLKIGNANSKHQKGVGNSFYGKQHSKETIEKLSLMNIGKCLSEETKLKISKSSKGKIPHNAKSLFFRGKNYQSLRFCSIQTGISCYKIKQEIK